MLFILIIKISLEWSLSIASKNIYVHKECTTLSTLYMTYDLLIKDIHKSSRSLKKWYKISPVEVIWLTYHGAIGWHYEKNNLIRKEGIYNAIKQEWTSYIQTYMGINISQFECKVYTQKEQARWVSFTIGTPYYTLEGTVTIT